MLVSSDHCAVCDPLGENMENETQSQLNKIREVREQLQEDFLSYFQGRLSERDMDTMCDIVVENFNKLLPHEGE